MLPKQSLSVRAHLLMLVAAIAIPLTVVVSLSVYEDTQQAVADAGIKVQSLAAIVAANTNRTLANSKERLDILAGRPLMRAVDETRCDPILADFRELFPRVANLTTIDLNGRAVCSAVPQPGGKPVNVFKTEWFQRALVEKRFLAGNPFRGPITGKWVSVLISPIHGEQNELVGFMGLPLDLDDFDPNIAGASIPEGSRYGIVGRDGTLIWRNVDPERHIGTKRIDSEVVRKLLALKQGVIDGVGNDGMRRYFAVAPIPETDWYAFVGVPHATAHAQVSTSVVRSAVTGLLGLLAVVALALFLARRVEQPIKALAVAARAVKGGNLDIRAAVAGPLEVAEVAAEFNAMMDAWSLSTRQLQASEERFRTVADFAGDWEYWEGQRQEILYMSPSCEAIAGYAPGQFITDPDLLNRIVHPDDRAAWDSHRHGVDGNMAAGQMDFRILRSDGDIRWIAHHCAGVCDHEGQYNGRRVSNRDITERKHMEEMLLKLSITDSLTGLPNRRYFIERMEEQLARVQRQVTLEAAVLMLDLDHFKQVNDLHGHAVGDAVLKHFAGLLRDDLRKIDMVGRLGGEEFGVVLPGANLAAAQVFAERLCRQMVDAPLVHDGQTIPVTVSIGIAGMLATDSAADAALNRADLALYRAKQAGRNRVSVADAADLPG